LLISHNGGQEKTMSTKGTLRLDHDDRTGESFHLYEDVFDEENVYLELEGCQFEASYGDRPRAVLRMGNRLAEKLGLIPTGSRTKQA
jgi:hypothetical protein